MSPRFALDCFELHRPRLVGAGPAIAVWLALVGSLVAQKGDVKGQVQPELPPEWVLPPPAPLSPTEEQATFRLQPGFQLELMASEPLVQDPICATCAADGSVWVCEWRSYMRDVDATDEHAKESRIVVLRDTDGDGRLDESKVFLDELVLPRAVLPLPGGALVILPPQIVWAEDRDGDGRADRVTEVAKGFQSGLDNPEHCGNGLLWGLDNRIHLANDRRIFRWSPQGFTIEPGAGGGQWGISQDDRGRLYFNYNEDWLRVDLVPGRYRARVLDQSSFDGCNHRVVADTSVWPIHATPGVNRGYQPGMLKDNVLTRHTAVCSPMIVRSDAMGDAVGDALVCEPAGNLVRRFRFAEQDGLLTASNVYDRAEFLASTDERFRPVSLFALADGSLGLVDMYRGVIQHRNYVTTFLRKQIVQRQLEQPIHRGRLWRIRAEGAAPPARPLAKATTAELVATLGAADGWQRDTAQRLLVLQRDPAAAPLLRDVVRRSPRMLARMHAAAALDGLGLLDANDLRVLLAAEDAGVLTLALQHCAPGLSAGDRVLWEHVERLTQHVAKSVRWHAVLALSEVEGKHAARALALCAKFAAAVGQDEVLLDALVAAGNGREGALVLALAAEPAFGEASARLLRSLASECGRERDRSGLSRRIALLEAAVACPSAWQQRAVLAGLSAALPTDPAQRAGFYVFAATPAPLVQLLASKDAEVAKLAQQVMAAVALRPDAGAVPVVDDSALSAEARALVGKGAVVFQSVCAACHQLDGRGMAGLAPPLRNSEWVTGDADVLVRIALHGVRGPIEAAGQRFDGEMPGQAYLSDADLAAALSWLRRAFGNQGEVIEPTAVKAVRDRHPGRAEPWTAPQLRAPR